MREEFRNRERKEMMGDGWRGRMRKGNVGGRKGCKKRKEDNGGKGALSGDRDGDRGRNRARLVEWVDRLRLQRAVLSEGRE
jgi:hypothetical protein